MASTNLAASVRRSRHVSYVQSVILPGETLLAVGKTHWFVYVVPGFWLLVSLVLFVMAPWIFGAALAALALILLAKAWVYTFSTELAVTSKRVITKFGFIRRTTVELRHDKVESMHVEQSIIGRIFDFGSIVITGSGGTHAPIPYIAHPLQFRSVALAGIEAPARPPAP
jgi:uncharacterized membrane protein YdbT with pleckstrin-like domain